MQELPLGKTQLRRKLDAPLEAAVRDLQSQYIGIPARRRQRAGAGDQKRLPFDLDAYRLRRNAREGGEDPDMPVGLEHIDRGLPAGSAGPSARRLEELAVKLLGLLQQRARFGPHVIFRITHHIFLIMLFPSFPPFFSSRSCYRYVTTQQDRQREDLSMSVRKRKWTTGKGETRESWVVSYRTRDGKQHIETFERKRR